MGPVAFLLNLLAKLNPGITSTIYSEKIYIFFSRIGGRISSLFAFSIAEFIIYYGGALVIITWLVSTIIRFHNGVNVRKSIIFNSLLNIAATLSVWYFLFIITCGLNYNRPPFAQLSGLEIRGASSQELYELTAYLAGEANILRTMSAENENGAALSQNIWDTASMAPNMYNNIANIYGFLGGWAPRTKPVMASKGMSYLAISGIFVPFTYECNVNIAIPEHNIPATMLHEIAHYKGFMQEEEANFISYLACVTSDNNDFKYSGTMLALEYSLDNLYHADSSLYYKVYDTLLEKVVFDLNTSSEYWYSHNGIIAETSTAVNDVYLRANSQASGVDSYGEIVDLLLAYHRSS